MMIIMTEVVVVEVVGIGVGGGGDGCKGWGKVSVVLGGV